jgi:hypothetical protein
MSDFDYRHVMLYRESVAEKRRVTNVTGLVYFIESQCAERRIKIGMAATPEARLAELQTGCPYELRLLATMPGGLRAEAELHARFADLWLIGEWYRPSAELRALIASLLPRGVDTGETHIACSGCRIPCIDCDVMVNYCARRRRAGLPDPFTGQGDLSSLSLAGQFGSPALFLEGGV